MNRREIRERLSKIVLRSEEGEEREALPGAIDKAQAERGVFRVLEGPGHVLVGNDPDDGGRL